ncbi:unnamed protein product [Polarella glacialis]|uniref:Carboxylic ester hydrolase n=1 Tax=Polarella glacialis TaxID=89957 RepID=A0A813JTC5_POLGL|nr:unnamed protein product [Polarella glacialis]
MCFNNSRVVVVCHSFGVWRFRITPKDPTSAKAVGKLVLSLAGVIKNAPVTLSDKVSEDCLYLNIVTPSLTGNLPVMLWIHGGVFLYGSGSDAIYRGTKLAEDEKVVIVTINYRLGCFGFLNVPGGDCNCGSWDQLEALRWIHSEIRHFGGDPSRITIMGESAGGMSCGVLLASPLSQPFFQRAILMSGAFSNVMSNEDAAHVSRQFCRKAGVEDISADSLRALSAEQLLTAQGTVPGYMPFQPCVDGELIPDLPLAALAREGISPQLSSKQVMVGFTAEEFNLFSPLPSRFMRRKPLAEVSKHVAAMLGPSRMAAAVDQQLPQEVEPEIRQLLKQIRAENNFSNWRDAGKQLMTLLVFHAPALLAAESLSRTAESVFVYSYNFDAGRFGSAHGSELALLFGTQRKHWLLAELSGAKKDPDSADAMSSTLMSRFAAFARTGSANSCSAAADWPVYNSGSGDESRSVFVLDRECKVVSPSGSAQRMMSLLSRVRRPFGFKPGPVLHAKL